ncbi:MAG: hypothetical protein M5R36_22290 [Deltaproteobacteria bacterium]|nr:hypothetical protein [Deltaproteobacteria bacterium]
MPQKDAYTILVLGGREGNPKRLVVRKTTLRRVGLACSVAALGLGVMLVDYVRARMELLAVHRREDELAQQLEKEKSASDERLRQFASLRDEVLHLRRALRGTSRLENDLRREQGLPAVAEPLIAAGERTFKFRCRTASTAQILRDCTPPCANSSSARASAEKVFRRCGSTLAT